MEAPARVAQQTFHQPTNRPTVTLNSVMRECRADLGQGPGHTLKNVHKTNHQSPVRKERDWPVKSAEMVTLKSILFFKPLTCS